MTPAEAIELIKKVAFSVENEIEEIKASKFITALKTAIETLEKQIPKKPYSDNDNGIYEKDCCPTCHRSLFPNDHHCKCGQALDWSDTK